MIKRNRELLGDEHYLLILQDYENIRAKSKSFRGKPDVYDRIEMTMNKMFEQHYKKFLD